MLLDILDIELVRGMQISSTSFSIFPLGFPFLRVEVKVSRE